MAEHKELKGTPYYKLPEYTVWASMKTRCNNPKSTYYNLYGGRGIKVCKRWLNSFSNFLSDMSERPTPLHTIERIDNDGNYEPNNCRWATSKEQASNRKTTRFIKIGNEIKSLAQWIELSEVKRSTVSMRLQRGWPIEKALELGAKNY